jgi:hypothetical protein
METVVFGPGGIDLCTQLLNLFKPLSGAITRRSWFRGCVQRPDHDLCSLLEQRGLDVCGMPVLLSSIWRTARARREVSEFLEKRPEDFERIGLCGARKLRCE